MPVIKITVLLPQPISDIDSRTILRALKSQAPALAKMEEEHVVYRVYERAYATGALAQSVKGTANTSGGDVGENSTMLATITADPSGETGRNYAPYQEGPPLGLHTYTNAARHFLWDAQTEDSDAIQAWADAAAELGIAQVEQARTELGGIEAI